MFPFALVLALSIQAASAPPPTADPFAALARYDGTWTVRAQHPFSPGAAANTPDTLVNHCRRGTAFFTCEQIVNGKPAALLIFTLSSRPNTFDVDTVLPNGHASSDTDLILSGPDLDHWTFLTKDAPNHPTFRVENTWSDSGHIRFEMFSTADGGATWTAVNQGTTTRTSP